MLLSTFRIIVSTLAAAAVCGCQTVSFSFGELRMLAPEYQGAAVDVLAKDVEGEDCVSVYGAPDQPSYGKAIANALQKVPGANVMQDVSFEIQQRFFWNCTWVKGDAGRFK